MKQETAYINMDWVAQRNEVELHTHSFLRPQKR
jgi:hypothetical protein